MDGVGKSLDGVLILGATNAPWDLDSAARRRFEKRIYIPLPDREAREALVRLKTRGIGGAIGDADVAQIAEWTEGYSGADIAIICRDAAMAPLNKIQNAEWFVEDVPSGTRDCRTAEAEDQGFDNPDHGLRLCKYVIIPFGKKSLRFRWRADWNIFREWGIWL
jgi:vacuolar protein-sorting-associated protein 4